MRKIIQITVIPDRDCNNPELFALCDDGKLFYSNITLTKGWCEALPIPQDGDKNESNT